MAAMKSSRTLVLALLAFDLCSASRLLAGDDVGPLVRALWLVQRHGTPEVVDSRNDQRLKGMLAKAMDRQGVLTTEGVNDVMEPATFAKLAGADGRLDPAEVRAALEAEVPESRQRLLPRIAAHAAYLSTTFDMIDDVHIQAGARLVDWISRNYRSGQRLEVRVICIGNTRRSTLGAVMGNIAASFYGMPEIRFQSGGTAPSAINPRTIATLRSIGVEVESAGKEAPRGEPNTPNPIYRIRWGQPGDSSSEMIEFSKKYTDPSDPRDGFAALLVCGEADAGCPVIKGAALRIAMPYLDPKIYDQSTYETVKYSERRDDIGRLLLSVLMQVRNRLTRQESR
jgi:arsenate reductase (thioredoxin)